MADVPIPAERRKACSASVNVGSVSAWNSAPLTVSFGAGRYFLYVASTARALGGFRSERAGAPDPNEGKSEQQIAEEEEAKEREAQREGGYYRMKEEMSKKNRHDSLRRGKYH